MGISAVSMVLGTPSDPVTKRLFPSFRRVDRPASFFVQGKVLEILWAEPEGQMPASATSYGPIDPASNIRRFIVVREGQGFSSCLPIVSCGLFGAAGPGIRTSDYGMVYTGPRAPEPVIHEMPDRGARLLPKPIQVIVDDRRNDLGRTSRINYRSVYSIQYNVKVKSFGKVEQSSMLDLKEQFEEVWTSDLSESRSKSSNHSNRQPVLTAESSRSARNNSIVQTRSNRAVSQSQTQSQAAFSALIERGYSRGQAAEILRSRATAKQALPRQFDEDEKEKEESETSEEDE